MIFFRLARVLQPVSDGPVHSDVGEPDQGNPQGRVAPGEQPQGCQADRKDRGVDQVVGDACSPGVDRVEQQRQVRREKKQGKSPSVEVEVGVGEQGDDEESQAFEMEEEARHAEGGRARRGGHGVLRGAIEFEDGEILPGDSHRGE